MGPAMAAVPHGVTWLLSFFRNRNGNRVKTAKKTRYHVKGKTALAGSKWSTCHAHSNPATHAKATADRASSANNLPRPSSRITNTSAKPNIGEGFHSGKCNVAITR